MTESYSSKKLLFHNPPKIVSLIQIIFTILILILTLNTAIDLVDQHQNLLRLVNDLPDTTAIISLLLLLISLIVLLYYILFALKKLFSAFSQLRFPDTPSKIPGDFNSEQEVVSGFKNRELHLYKEDPRLKKQRWIFGKNTRFLSPAIKNVFISNSKSLNSRVGKILFLIIFLGFLTFLQNYPATNEYLPGFGELIPIILILVLQIMLFFAEMAIGKLMVPHKAPGTQALEGNDHYRGFGHPSQLFSRIPDLALPLRWDNFPNRVIKGGGETASSVVGDIGNFSGYLLIEQQPVLEKRGKTGYKYWFFLIGWLLALISAVSLFVFFMPQVITLQNNYITLIGILLFGWFSKVNSRKFLNRADALFEILTFKSQAILIDLEGNLFRSDIRIGKAMVDSIESSNVAIRSDFTARFWSAELISEVKTIDSKRDLLALRINKECENWMDFFKREILKLRDEGIKPLGVDFRTSEVDNMVKANVAISSMRSGEENHLLSHQQSPISLTSKPKENTNTQPQRSDQIPSQSSTQPVNIGDYKECPRCAEMVRAKATVCRFCGYEFPK